jgi:hypothetical protein
VNVTLKTPKTKPKNAKNSCVQFKNPVSKSVLVVVYWQAGRIFGAFGIFLAFLRYLIPPSTKAVFFRNSPKIAHN